MTLALRLEEFTTLLTVRRAAWERFVRSGGELGLSGPFRELLKLPVEGTEVLPLSEPALRFLDGALQPISSPPPSATLLPLSQAATARAPYFEQIWARAAEQCDPLLDLNLALHKEGAWLYLPSQVKAGLPLEVVTTASSQEAFSFARLHLVLGAGAELKLHLTHAAGHLVIEGDLQPGARLQIQSEVAGSCAVRLYLKKGAVAKFHGVTTSSYAALDAACTFLEEEAEAFSSAVAWRANWAQVRMAMDHRAPKCRSSQRYRAVVEEGGRSQFVGKIAIQKGAYGTDASQEARSLLLGPHARALCTPLLNIHADDVSASHGATVSTVSEEELFYLQSRGFSKEQAKEALAEAFCKEVALI